MQKDKARRQLERKTRVNRSYHHITVTVISSRTARITTVSRAVINRKSIRSRVGVRLWRLLLELHWFLVEIILRVILLGPRSKS